jgi:hypothetical protein
MIAPLAAGPVQSELGERPEVGRREWMAAAGGSVVALLALAIAVPHTSADPPHQPAWVDPALSHLPAGTKVLDDWGWGGYLMWRYPQLDLMMHGYGDTFTTAELTRNQGLVLLSPGWEDSLRAAGARVAVLRSSSWLADELVSMEGWRIVHDADTYVMLRAPASWVSHGPAVAPVDSAR